MNLKGRSWQVGKIIEVAQAAKTGQTGCASTSEKIAVSYILDDPKQLPDGYSIVDAWWMLSEEWQGYVRDIRLNYMGEI